MFILVVVMVEDDFNMWLVGDACIYILTACLMCVIIPGCNLYIYSYSMFNVRNNSWL